MKDEKKDIKLDVSYYSVMNQKTKDRFVPYLIDLLYDRYFNEEGEYLFDGRVELDTITLNVILPYLLSERIDKKFVRYPSKRKETGKSLLHVLDLSSMCIVVDYDDIKHPDLKAYHKVRLYTDIYGTRILVGREVSTQYMRDIDIKMLQDEIENSKQEKKEQAPYVKIK